jgi:phosphatidylserine/phosphatidylglycerophosphate/cardiolipin synthase-like enzyme
MPLAVHEYCCCNFICHCCNNRFIDDDEEAFDDDAQDLSYVGTACYDALRSQHRWFHHSLWNVTSGSVVSLDPTPRESFSTSENLPAHHSDWFPEKMGEMVRRTEHWCDVMSLGPPDGIFMTAMQDALKHLHSKNKKIIVRMMFGNIVGMPVNCSKLIKTLTKDIPSEKTHLRLWVGAWRKGISWNHAKIIAVDGNFLHTGGHNMWDGHYLKHDPVHDLSLELNGRVTHDSHLYANEQWQFIERMQNSICGYVIDKLPDSLPMVLKSRVTVSEFPVKTAPVYPPVYSKGMVPKVLPARSERQVPIISMGRYGKLTRFSRRPSDDGILAMLRSAKTIIRLALQDLGPVCIPGTKITVPGCVWPHDYLSALGRVIWERGVDVEIVLSNPNSIPGGLKPTEANYGNGWSCVDVAAEIIKTIRQQFPNASDTALREKVAANLRVCFLRSKRGQQWEDGESIGLHSKHFIVDDICCYIGSQNLYICDLAEWGVVIDHKEQVQSFMDEYWIPLWSTSYTPDDCDVQAVMDGLEFDRDGENVYNVSNDTKEKMEAAKQKTGQDAMAMGAQGGVQSGGSEYHLHSDEEKAEDA